MSFKPIITVVYLTLQGLMKISWTSGKTPILFPNRTFKYRILMPFFYRLIFIYLYWEAIIMALDTKAGVAIFTLKYNKSLK